MLLGPMIKPIVYQNIEEKEALERKLMDVIPDKTRASASKALMNIFSHPEKERLVKKGSKQQSPMISQEISDAL